MRSISVKNFGPVDEAKIDISPLTIFVGKNSSGKSFLSLLIHALSNPFNHNSHRFPAHSLDYLMNHNGELFGEFEYELEKYLSSKPSFTDESFKFSLNKFIILINEGFGKCYTNLIENELKSNWKSDLNEINRKKIHPFEITFNDIIFINENDNLINKNLFDKIGSLIKSINFINPIGVKISCDDSNININIDYQLWMKMYGGEEDISLAQVIYVLIASKLVDELKDNSFYIPAGGEIFNDFNNYISNELSGINESSNIQKEFITNLLNINKGSKKGYFYDLACELENEINNGEVQIKTEDLKDEFIFVDNENNLEFELNMMSSSVHELIPLIIYMKYYLNKNDTLIIEEIENHLHPENQLILVKYLVKAINQGLNIILTTHSDYILEKFNNLIRLGNCENAVFDELPYDETCILNYNDVKVYNFKKNDDYSYTPHIVDVNFTGFSDENFSQVIDELYHESDIMDEYKIR